VSHKAEITLTEFDSHKKSDSPTQVENLMNNIRLLDFRINDIENYLSPKNVTSQNDDLKTSLDYYVLHIC